MCYIYYLRYTRAFSAVIDAAVRFRPVWQRDSWAASIECEGKRGKEEKGGKETEEEKEEEEKEDGQEGRTYRSWRPKIAEIL